MRFGCIVVTAASIPPYLYVESAGGGRCGKMQRSARKKTVQPDRLSPSFLANCCAVEENHGHLFLDGSKKEVLSANTWCWDAVFRFSSLPFSSSFCHRFFFFFSFKLHSSFCVLTNELYTTSNAEAKEESVHCFFGRRPKHLPRFNRIFACFH